MFGGHEAGRGCVVALEKEALKMDRFRRNKVSRDRRIKALISLIIVGYFLAVGLTYHYQGIHAAIGSVVVAVAISVNLFGDILIAIATSICVISGVSAIRYLIDISDPITGAVFAAVGVAAFYVIKSGDRTQGARRWR